MKLRSIFFGSVVFVAVVSSAIMGCSSGSNDYENTLKSGIEKYENGEEMTQEEYNAVKNFNDWSEKQSEKQSEKTYSEWEY